VETVNQDNSTNEELTRYLLGEMPEEEQTDFEMRYFSDGQLFGELCARRNQLIDSYVSGRLAPPMRERFEAGIDKSWAINERIRFAETLQGAMDTRSVGLTSAPQTHYGQTRAALSSFVASYGRLMIVAAIVLVLLGVGWLILRSRHQESVDLNQAGSGNPSSASADKSTTDRPSLATSPAAAQTRDNYGSILTVPLTSDLTATASDARADVLVLPSVVLVKLVLIVDDPRDVDYTAVVTTAKDAEIFRTGSLKPHPNDAGKGVDVYVPANRLPDGDYIVHLSGVTANNEAIAAGNYYLRVRKS
jgi:hypothetical protein